LVTTTKAEKIIKTKLKQQILTNQDKNKAIIVDKLKQTKTKK